MRLFPKIFICVAAALCAAILFSGYLLITDSYEHAIERELERAVNQYRFDRFAVQAEIISNADDWQDGISYGDAELSGLASEIGGTVGFFVEDEFASYTDFSGIDDTAPSVHEGFSTLYSEYPEDTKLPILAYIPEDKIVYRFQKIGENDSLVIGSKLTQSGVSVYILIATDISPIAAQKDEMLLSFRNAYAITIAAGMIVILLLSALITRPVKRLTKAVGGMARGDLGLRLPESGADEIGELSAGFNAMADSIGEKMNALELNAKQKEDFAASFAHELKTPLTSVIGYADMLYQKDLTPEQTKNAAMYILSEGLRLEALSLKLMELIVLGKEDFVLEDIPAGAVLENVVEGLRPVFEEKKITVHLDAEASLVKVEFDLFKTLLFNLIDNSAKAGCTEIWVSGKAGEDLYTVSVTDNGRGIPAAELGRITEAFYMVDKSRARRQHGAGLGLALVSKIAEIHGSRLEFKSAVEVGTTATVRLKRAKIAGDTGDAENARDAGNAGGREDTGGGDA